VRDPQEALEAARREAAGAAPGDGPPWTLDDPSFSSTRLVEWAILAPDEAKVYSTRPLGRPITLLKRGLVRLLRQYLNEVNAQQSRFNALVAAHVMRLEQRVEELERRAAEREPPAR
jgi:hypothetical protein